MRRFRNRKTNPLLDWMNQIAQRQLQQREDTIAAIHTVAEAKRRQQWVREKLILLLGGLPDYHGPLNARSLEVFTPMVTLSTS